MERKIDAIFSPEPPPSQASSQDIPPDISTVLDSSRPDNPDDNPLKPLDPNLSNQPSSPQEKNLYSPEELSPLISLANQFSSLKKQADSLPAGSEKTNLLTQAHSLLQQIKQDFNTLKTTKERQIQEARQKELMGNLPEQIKKAESILGSENVLTHEDISHPEYGFGFEITEPIPPIPESILNQLEKAKELGEMLVLRVTQDKDAPITMKHLLTTQYQKFHSHGAGKILYAQESSDSTNLHSDRDWLKDKLFFTTQKDNKNNPQIKLEWKLVSKNIIPDTNSKNHQDQTNQVIEYFKQKGIMPPEENFNNPDGSINKEKLSQYFQRRTPLESMYDTLLYFQKSQYKDEARLLKGVYDWTDTESEEASVRRVRFGSFDPDGANVSRHDPVHVWSIKGVCSSRT